MNGVARCAPRGRGRCPMTVAMYQVPGDYTRSPRRRAGAKIVLDRRGRLISRCGENKGKWAMCEPSTLHRAACSRPTRRQRSARTSSPRRARTARASEGGRCTNSRSIYFCVGWVVTTLPLQFGKADDTNGAERGELSTGEAGAARCFPCVGPYGPWATALGQLRPAACIYGWAFL
jgi:hypothetical protein